MLNINMITQELHLAIDYKKSSPSTQADAKEAAMAGTTSAKLFVADHQSHAVGRYGRSFHAVQNEGIYMSLLLPGSFTEDDIAPFTMMSASAIILAIKELTGISCQLKWVNDIFLDNKKIAGILCEVVRNPDNLKISHLIIGIGLNFSIQNFPNPIENKAGSLFNTSLPTIKRENLICKIWQIFNLKPKQELIETYKKNSLVLNKQVSFMQNQTIIHGLVTDISDMGHLTILRQNGEMLTLSSGEVSLLSW